MIPASHWLVCVCLVASENPRQNERLGRGVVAIHQGAAGVFVGWRLLGDDPEDVAFNVYRADGDEPPVKLNDEPLSETTNLIDRSAKPAEAHAWSVRPIIDGKEVAAGGSCSLPAGSEARPYLSIPLDTLPGHTPNDASAGDIDGDGEYEIVLKQEMRPRDNSQRGTTGETKLEAYRLDGALLWRINLGKNIREGAHYTPFIVFDLDGDGRGETISAAKPRSCNFGVWWDGDLLRELLDRTTISKWDWRQGGESVLLSAASCASNNGSKATPALCADLLGDWREEVVWRSADNRELRIYTTTIPTKHRLPTLMHDPQYRLSVAWQNVGYNQPTQTGFYLGAASAVEDLSEQEAQGGAAQ